MKKQEHKASELIESRSLEQLLCIKKKKKKSYKNVQFTSWFSTTWLTDALNDQLLEHCGAIKVISLRRW